MRAVEGFAAHGAGESTVELRGAVGGGRRDFSVLSDFASGPRSPGGRHEPVQISEGTRAALIKERSVSKMQSSECVVGDKRDRHGNPNPCARKPIFAKWDRIMGSQGSSARVLTNWKMKDLRDLEAALDRAANALGVRF